MTWQPSEDRVAPGATLSVKVNARFLQAFQLELAAWITFFTEWLDRAGREKVRRAIIKNAEAVQARFVGLATTPSKPTKRAEGKPTK